MSGPVDIPSIVTSGILQDMKNSITGVLTLLEDTFNKIDLARVDRQTIKELRSARHATEATLSMYEKSCAMIKELNDALDNSRMEDQLTEIAKQLQIQFEREHAEVLQLEEKNYELEGQKIEIQTNMKQTVLDHYQEITHLNKEMTGLRSKNSELQDNIKILNADKDTVLNLRQDIGSKITEIKHLTSKNTQLEGIIENLNTEKSAFTLVKEELQRELDSAVNLNMGNLHAKATALQELAVERMNLGTVQKELGAMTILHNISVVEKDKLAAANEKLIKENAEIGRRVTVLETSNAAREKRSTEDVNNQNKDMKQLRTELLQAQIHSTTVQAELENKTAKLMESAGLAEKLQTKSTDYKDVSNELRLKTEECGRLGEEITRLSSKNGLTATELGATQLQLELANNLVTGLREEIVVQKNKIAILNSELTAHKTEGERTQSNITDLLDGSTQLRIDLRNSEYSLSVAEEHSRGLEIQLSNAAETATKSRDEIKKLETTNEQLQTDVRSENEASISYQLSLSRVNGTLNETKKNVVENEDKIKKLEAMNQTSRADTLKAMIASTEFECSLSMLNWNLEDRERIIVKGKDKIKALEADNESLRTEMRNAIAASTSDKISLKTLNTKLGETMTSLNEVSTQNNTLTELNKSLGNDVVELKTMRVGDQKRMKEMKKHNKTLITELEGAHAWEKDLDDRMCALREELDSLKLSSHTHQYKLDSSVDECRKLHDKLVKSIASVEELKPQVGKLQEEKSNKTSDLML